MSLTRNVVSEIPFLFFSQFLNTLISFLVQLVLPKQRRNDHAYMRERKREYIYGRVQIIERTSKKQRGESIRQ